MTAPRTNAGRDQNHVTTLLGVSTADGTTPVPVEVDPINGQLQVNASVTAATLTTATTPTVTSVASSATSVSLLALNSSRRMATFYNDSTQVLYLKLGTTASSSSYTIQMAASSYYELPAPIWTGAIDGIWASANGNVRITELT